MHFEDESGIGAHCLRLHLGSLGDPRYDTPCTHKHPEPRFHKASPYSDMEAPPVPSGNERVRATIQRHLGFHDRLSFSSTCRQYRNSWLQESSDSLWHGVPAPAKNPTTFPQCVHPKCNKRSGLHCQYCDKSLCRDHCQKEICSAEILPKGRKGDFVCTSCSPKIEACKHSDKGCATCDEIFYFKQDLMHCVQACNDDQLVGLAKNVCQAIDVMVGHTARIKNQERYWPDLLEKLRLCKEYDHVLLKSDYWKKFEGTVMKQGLGYPNPSSNRIPHTPTR